MKKFRGLILAVVLSAGLFAGCDYDLFDKKVKDTEHYVRILPQTLNQSEPVIVALEDATGKTIPEDISSKGESVSNKVEDIASKGQAAVTTLKAFAPVTALYADTAYTVLGIIGTLAGAAGTFFNRRKAKSAEQETKTMIKAVDQIPGVGKKVEQAANLAGTAKGIKKKYIEVKAGI